MTKLFENLEPAHWMNGLFTIIHGHSYSKIDLSMQDHVLEDLKQKRTSIC